MIEGWKRWAGTIKRDAHALYLASRDPRVPWYAKVIAVSVPAYAASPIDLIPDFIPVIGYLDDLIIVPLGIALVIKLIPPELMAEHRALAMAAQDQPVSRIAAAVIMAILSPESRVGAVRPDKAVRGDRPGSSSRNGQRHACKRHHGQNGPDPPRVQIFTFDAHLVRYF
jgi:uncharacterized membrane protein YkvA (DUF1232 family)